MCLLRYSRTFFSLLCWKFRLHCGLPLAAWLRHLGGLHCTLQHLHCSWCEFSPTFMACVLLIKFGQPSPYKSVCKGWVRPNPNSKMVSELILDLLLGFSRCPRFRHIGALAWGGVGNSAFIAVPSLAAKLQYMDCLCCSLQHLHCVVCEGVDLVLHCLEICLGQCL
jgi:hypothetical protein